jgi:TonB family protein
VGKGSDVTPPRVIHSVNPQFSDKARKAVRDQKVKVTEFRSVISFVVDTSGNPTNLCLKTPAGYGLDAEAGKALEEYRFEPAKKKKNKEPVAARMSIAFSFHIY